MGTFQFATAGDDVRVWNASTLELLHHFYVPGSPKARCIAWSDDGQRLLAIPKSGEFVFFTELAGSEPEQTTVKLSQTCTCAAFRQTSSRFLGIGCSNGDVLVWDLNGRKLRGTFKPHKAAVTSVAFNVSDSVLASSGEDGGIALNNTVIMSSFTTIASLEGQVVRRLLFAPYRKYLLASASDRGRIDLWDASSHKRSHTFSGLHENTTGVAFSPVNDSFMLSVGTEGNVGMYDVGNKKLHKSVRSPEGLHSVCFLHNGICFVTGGASGHVYVYDVRQSRDPIVKTLLAHVGPVTYACMQPLGKGREGARGPLAAASSFVLKPVETRAPMTLTSVVPEDDANALSPLTAFDGNVCSLGMGLASQVGHENGPDVQSPLPGTKPGVVNAGQVSLSAPLDGPSNAGRSLRTLRRDTRLSEISSLLSASSAIDYAEGYGFWSPLNASRSGGADNFRLSHEPLSPHRLESSPALPEPIPGRIFLGHEDTGENAASCSADADSSAEHGKRPSQVRCRTVSVPSSHPDRGIAESTTASDPFSEGSGTERATPSAVEGEEARVEREIQRLRLLYDVADDDAMLAMATTAQVVRRVLRQELSNVVEIFRAELNSRFNDVLVDLRSLSAEIRALKEF